MARGIQALVFAFIKPETSVALIANGRVIGALGTLLDIACAIPLTLLGLIVKVVTIDTSITAIIDATFLAHLAVRLFTDCVITFSRHCIELEVYWASCADAETVFSSDNLETIVAFLAHVRALAFAIFAVRIFASSIYTCLRLSIKPK